MTTDYLKLYNHVLASPVNKEHRLAAKGKDAVGPCPFCEGKGFSVHLETGRAKCWKCEVSVNFISFLTRFHREWLKHTPDEYYEELVEARGIPIESLKHAQLAYDGNNDRWIVPYKNPASPHLYNLGNFRDTGDNAYTVFVLPKEGIFPKQLYNPFTFTTKPAYVGQKLIIAEGEWDAISLHAMVSKSIRDPKKVPAVLGAPGASIIPTNTPNIIRQYQKVILTYDNDTQGEKGTHKMAAFLNAEGFEVEYLNWSKLGETFPDGADIRDLLTKYKKPFLFLQKGFDAIEVEKDEDGDKQELGPGYISTVEGIDPVDSYKDYFKLYEEHMYLTQINRDAMTVGLGVSVGTLLPGEPLWVFFVGRASDGKTTFIESFGGQHEWCDYSSKLTKSNLVTGWSSGGDSSSILTMNNKLYCIKDFTVVLGMDKAQQRELFDILRDLYDGSLKIRFGNGIERNYQNINFNLIAGVTPAIYKLNDAQLGERFLRIDYSGRADTSDESLINVLQQFGKSTQKKDALTRATIGYMKHVRSQFWKDPANLPSLTPGGYELISTIARYVAAVRTKPEHSRSDGLIYRPTPEAPPRLGLQFMKLAYSLSKVTNPNATVKSTLPLTDYQESLLVKTAHDTCYGFSQDVLKGIHDRPKSSAPSLAKSLGIPQTRCYRVLQDLMIVGLVNTITQFGTGGRSTLLYRLSPSSENIVSQMLLAREDQE